jgi:hypothetical protein
LGKPGIVFSVKIELAFPVVIPAGVFYDRCAGPSNMDDLCLRTKPQRPTLLSDLVAKIDVFKIEEIIFIEVSSLFQGFPPHQKTSRTQPTHFPDLSVRL